MEGNKMKKQGQTEAKSQNMCLAATKSKSRQQMETRAVHNKDKNVKWTQRRK